MNDIKVKDFLDTAIKKINPNAQYTLKNGQIIWLNNTTPISDSDIETKKNELELEEKNARTSAINKLKGATYSALTDAEAKALFGE